MLSLERSPYPPTNRRRSGGQREAKASNEAVRLQSRAAVSGGREELRATAELGAAWHQDFGFLFQVVEHRPQVSSQKRCLGKGNMRGRWKLETVLQSLRAASSEPSNRCPSHFKSIETNLSVSYGAGW